ncbi:hypothetical protein Tco_0053198 [Tanacetum coccineum]
MKMITYFIISIRVDSDNDVEGAKVAGAKSGEDATDCNGSRVMRPVKDTNTDLDGRDKVMTDVEDTHVTLTSVNPDGPQQSYLYVSSGGRTISPDLAWNTSVPDVHVNCPTWRLSSLAPTRPSRAFEVYKPKLRKIRWINPVRSVNIRMIGTALPLVPKSPVTKTKAADSRTYQMVRRLGAYSDVGQKRRQFYAFATSRESARDVYSKRRIVAVTKVEIVEWHDYKHLDWITVRRDDDALYKDLMETPYSDPRGFIYENKDKKNRLMRIDELHKFSDGTLDDVRTALNDRLKGIRMEYLPQTF